MGGSRGPRATAHGLTARERQTIRVLLAGATNRQIAQSLGLSEQTVRNRLSVIYTKCGVRNRLELVLALGRGQPGDDSLSD